MFRIGKRLPCCLNIGVERRVCVSQIAIFAWFHLQIFGKQINTFCLDLDKLQISLQSEQLVDNPSEVISRIE